VNDETQSTGGNAVILRKFGNDIFPQRKADAFVNATAMCKAFGREWSAYWRTADAQAFATALSDSLKIHRESLIESRGGRTGGTWVHPDIAIDVARWCNPAFAVQMARWTRELLTTGRVEIAKPATRPVTLGPYTRRAFETWRMSESVPEGHWTVFHESMGFLIHAEVAYCAVNLEMDRLDLLDGSIGKAYSKCREGKDWAGERVRYTHVFPDQRGRREAWAYPDAELKHFRRWLRDVYPQQHFGAYIVGRFGEAALAPVAIALKPRGVEIKHALLLA